MATAIFPGSFDPFTEGHLAVARRVAPLFDRLVVAVGVNSNKTCMFTAEERVSRIAEMIKGLPNVEATSYTGMTIDFCHRVGAQCIVRGIRTAADFEYEQLVASVNREQDPSIETLLVMADADHQAISSTLERERLRHAAR
ncbi:MAG: pantetheine-phosphate adenylyltransferase [Bacteroidales bacterium]|nr:pantetheine-phosphate adenylyltransferase [Bacteroidales bacterium]